MKALKTARFQWAKERLWGGSEHIPAHTLKNATGAPDQPHDRSHDRLRSDLRSQPSVARSSLKSRRTCHAIAKEQAARRATSAMDRPGGGPHVGAERRPHEYSVPIARVAARQHLGREHVGGAVAQGENRHAKLGPNEALVLAASLDLERGTHRHEVESKPVPALRIKDRVKQKIVSGLLQENRAMTYSLAQGRVER